MHYTTNGIPAKDRTSIGFIFAKQPPAKVVGGLGNLTKSDFVIPPQDGNYEMRVSTTLTEDKLLTTMMPHMHARGKDMTYIAHYADGRSETLLSVPKYDFNWQITYELGAAEAAAEGHARRGHRALRQLGEQPVQPRPGAGSPVGRSDVGRDDDRRHDHARGSGRTARRPADVWSAALRSCEEIKVGAEG